MGADDSRNEPPWRREQTLIFSHPEGKRMGLFILDLDGTDLDVVQVSVDPDRLNETILKYKHHDMKRSGRRGPRDRLTRARNVVRADNAERRKCERANRRAR